MARTARMYLETSFFHVMVEGINKEFIFNNERYIKRYLQIVNKHEKELNIQIIAYCIMNNHSHFLINTEEISSLSKFMQKINSEYARYYNYMEGRVGYVFRDRYKSEPILDKRQLLQCIKYIHRNPVKANMVAKEEEYQYSSYNYYIKMMKHNDYDIFDNEEFKYICGQNYNENIEFMDIDENIDNKINYLISKFIKVSVKYL